MRAVFRLTGRWLTSRWLQGPRDLKEDILRCRLSHMRISTQHRPRRRIAPHTGFARAALRTPCSGKTCTKHRGLTSHHYMHAMQLCGALLGRLTGGSLFEEGSSGDAQSGVRPAVPLEWRLLLQGVVFRHPALHQLLRGPRRRSIQPQRQIPAMNASLRRCPFQ